MNASISGNSKMAVTGRGNVGIGTTAPAYNLDVTGSVRSTNRVSAAPANANLGVHLFTNGQDGATATTYQGGLESWWGIGFRNSWTGATNIMFDTRSGQFTTTGNVGIDTTSPAQKLDVTGNIRTTGAIVYNTLQDFRLVYREDFESTATGWQNNTRSTCGSATILGGYNTFAGGNVYKDYDLTGIPHTEVMVKLTYYFIDSWDGESAYIQVGGISTYYKSHIFTAAGVSQICGLIAHGEHVAATESRISHTGNSLRVLVGSTLDQVSSDESFGIDNVEIWVR